MAPKSWIVSGELWATGRKSASHQFVTWKVISDWLAKSARQESCSAWSWLMAAYTWSLYEAAWIVLDAYIRHMVNINAMQFGLLPGKSITDAIFIVHHLQEKYIAHTTFSNLPSCAKYLRSNYDHAMIHWICGTKDWDETPSASLLALRILRQPSSVGGSDVMDMYSVPRPA